MGKIKNGFQELIKKLSSDPEVGGLEIRDLSLQYANIKKGKVENFSVRLPQGVMEEGIIKEREKLVEYLLQLHDMIAPKERGRVIKVTTSLQASIIYTQSFKIPLVAQEKMEESASLNLQVISPIEAEKACMSWQKIGEAQTEQELLGAFVEKKSVMDIQKTLDEANFYPVVFEFSALGIARLLKTLEGVSKERALVLEISPEGMDFLIVKNGELYFDYFVSWKKIQKESPQITQEMFEENITREVRKVSNFALNRVGGNIDEVLYLAPGMEAQVQAILEKNPGVKAKPLVFPEHASLGPTWYATIGSALRRDSLLKKEQGINLGPETLEKALFEERLVNFGRMWRNIIATTLGAFLLLYGALAVALVAQSKEADLRLGEFTTQNRKLELEALEHRANEFNSLVRYIGKIKEEKRDKSLMLKKILELADNNGVFINSLTINKEGNVQVTGSGASHNTVVSFKGIVAKESDVEKVELPLSRIKIGRAHV